MTSAVPEARGAGPAAKRDMWETRLSLSVALGEIELS